MDKQKEQLLEQAIELELNMSDLYTLYSEKFSKDREFWLKISDEENNHANLLKSAKEYFTNLPDEIIYGNINELEKANQDIKDAIKKYRQTVFSREEAYNFAVDKENGAFELHYQQLMSEPAGSEKLKTLQKLNKDDKDHAKRIIKLLEKDAK